MARSLNGKVVIITGASSGIGAATAIEAGRAGMRVVLAARRADRLEDVDCRVREVGGEAIVSVTDVANPAQIDAMVQRTLEQWGRIDVLFANAGFGLMHELADEAELEQRMWEINYFAALRCIRAVIPIMRRQGSGHILVCSSIVGRIGLPYYGAYSATKAAQHAMTAALGLELEPHGIAVTGVYASGTQSEFFERVAGHSGCDGISGNTPSIFIQTAESVARKIVRCMRRPKPELWPSLFSRIGTVVWTASPRLYRFCFRFHARGCRRTMTPPEPRESDDAQAELERSSAE